MTKLAPRVLGILNITEDSFSDGGRFLSPDAALAHARKLAAQGAVMIDIGAASSRPDALPVASEIEIARLAPVVESLQRDGIAISIDSFAPETQRWALTKGVAAVNDVRGFPEASLYPALATSQAKLIIMHSVTGAGPAIDVAIEPKNILSRIEHFFDQRIAALSAAGIARERLILDPGMGFFLGNRREASLRVLKGLPALKARYNLPLLISVSRKSFLRRIADVGIAEAGPATLAAELFAALNGADFIRSHDPGALVQALTVWQALDSGH